MFNSTGSRCLGPELLAAATFITIGTSYYHQPVPIAPPSFGTGWWFKPVHMLTHWNQLEPPPGANCPPLGRSKAKCTSCCCSRYLPIGTGCNSSWYLWPGPMARFLVVAVGRRRLQTSLRPVGAARACAASTCGRRTATGVRMRQLQGPQRPVRAARVRRNSWVKECAACSVLNCMCVRCVGSRRA